MHNDNNLWEAASKFMPERFLSKDNARARIFFPFGGGHRMCIGKRIAHLEAVAFLARFVQTYDISDVQGFEPKEQFAVTLSSSNGVQIRLAKKKALQ
jgi:cytochrome P450